MGSGERRGSLLTEKSGVVAQVLSPAALTMQPLSMWPEPTRLVGCVSYTGLDRVADGPLSRDGEYSMAYLEST